jgi:hypothetical protein
LEHETGALSWHWDELAQCWGNNFTVCVVDLSVPSEKTTGSKPRAQALAALFQSHTAVP